VRLLQVTPDLPNPAEYEADRIATEISKTISSNKVIGMFLSDNATRLPSKGYRTVLTSDFGKELADDKAGGLFFDRVGRRERGVQSLHLADENNKLSQQRKISPTALVQV
jgi:hypothetical protein